MKYTILKIEENLEYGCEESTEILAVVTMQDEAGNTIIRKDPDQELISKNIEEGSQVIIDENNKLQLILGEDWTGNCRTSNVDINKFTDMMLQVKAGKPVDWICPFCGGNVELMKQTGGHTVIGCDSCDMRITLDN